MNSGNNNEFPPGESGAPPADGADAPLNMGKPAVAAAPGKLMFVILFAGFFIFIIVRSLFFGEKPEEKEIKHVKEHVISANTKEGGVESVNNIQAGALPTAPTELPVPTAPSPPLPPPPPALLTPPGPDLHAGAPNDEVLSRRLHSPMFIISAGASKLPGGDSFDGTRKGAIAGGNDPNAAFAESVANSQGQKARATKIANLDSTIVQGKLIHAVLESAIDSDLPTPIRAIVSHDIYAEAGKEILIPKGSRIIGDYNAQVKRGQVRVFIVWERVVRPDGIDIQIESPGVDMLGRAGMEGDVDNKYFEMFSTAVMTSAMDIGVAAVGDALFGNQQTTTTSNTSGTTTTESPTAAAMQQAVQNIGQIGTNIVNTTLNDQPTIYVDQGTPIDVFVNRDLIFPREVTGAAGGFIP